MLYGSWTWNIKKVYVGTWSAICLASTSLYDIWHSYNFSLYVKKFILH